MNILTLQGPSLDDSGAAAIAASVDGQLEAKTAYYQIRLNQPLSDEALAGLRRQHRCDINRLPDTFDPANVRLLITDMDSTLISIECIDEIADFLDIKTQIATITESAMRGEIDFETSLQQRMALLHGLDAGALQQVYDQRLQLNPGAEQMIHGLQQHGIKVALVSGGFTFFTERLKKRLNLDYTLANELEFNNGKLAGLSNRVIVGAKRKAEFLHELCNTLAISTAQAVAMGDGANDLLMMQQAGLSIAYHAKPAVQQQATTVLNYCGLEGVLGLLGIAD